MRTILTTLCCLLPVAAVVAQEPTPAAQYEALTTELKAASTAWSKALRDARAASDDEAAAQLLKDRPTTRFLQRFVDFAKAHPGTEPELPCLTWIVQSDADFGQAAHFAMDRLATAHAEAKELGTLMRWIKYRLKAEDRVTALQWLGTIAAKNPDPDVRAEVLIARAGLCIGTTGTAETEAERNGAVADLQQAVDLARDDKLRQTAQDGIAEEGRLGIGKMAPDIEAEDLDGVSFKLSDYRGKVVMLDFWGDW